MAPGAQRQITCGASDAELMRLRDMRLRDMRLRDMRLRDMPHKRKASICS